MCELREERSPLQGMIFFSRLELFMQSVITSLLLLLLFKGHAFWMDFSGAYILSGMVSFLLSATLFYNKETAKWSAFFKRILLLFVLQLAATGALRSGLALPEWTNAIAPLAVGAVYTGWDLLAARQGRKSLHQVSWPLLIMEMAVALCVALFAAGVDRSVDQPKSYVQLTLFLTLLVTTALFSGVGERVAIALRKHSVRFWAFTLAMTVGMTFAISFYVRFPLERFIPTLQIGYYTLLSHDLAFFSAFVTLLVFFSVACHLAIPFVRRFFSQMDRFEKRYLVISLLAYTAVITLLCITTNLFSYPFNNQFTYDNVFTSDTRVLTQGFYNAFSNINCAENDIRQMLFAVVSLPASAFAYVFAFIANLVNAATGFHYVYWHLFGVGMMYMQAVMMAFIAIMLRRILRTMITDAYAKIFTVIFALSYSSMIFTFVVEQYVMALFTLMFTVYVLVCDYSERKAVVGIAYSAGTLTPSVTTGAMLLMRGRPFKVKSFIKAASYSILFFLFLVLVFGQISQVIGAKDYLTGMVNSFGGTKISLTDKVYQYLEAVSNMLFSPALRTEVTAYEAMGIRVVAGRVAEQVLGTAILTLALIGGLFSFKKAAGRIATYWILVSIGVLVVVGWGAKEHGMILYSSYFFWAFLILIAGLFDALFKDMKNAGTTILISLAAAVGVYNLYGFYQMFLLACTYYPARV